jgi:RHS repeat-associated protein
MLEWDKYSAYGVPFGLPGGDTDSDGDCDATDVTQVQTWIDASAYDVRGDVDLDGDVDATDKSQIQASGTTLGRGSLSAAGLASRKGFGGYRADMTLDNYCIRNRHFSFRLGIWHARDPIGYSPGMNMYEYVGSNSQRWLDPLGLGPKPGFGGGGPNVRTGYPAGPGALAGPPSFKNDPCDDICKDWQASNPPGALGETVCNGKGGKCACVHTGAKLFDGFMEMPTHGTALENAQQGGTSEPSNLEDFEECVQAHEDYHKEDKNADCKGRPAGSTPSMTQQEWKLSQIGAVGAGWGCFNSMNCPAGDTACEEWKTALRENAECRLENLGVSGLNLPPQQCK